MHFSVYADSFLHQKIIILEHIFSTDPMCLPWLFSITMDYLNGALGEKRQLFSVNLCLKRLYNLMFYLNINWRPWRTTKFGVYWADITRGFFFVLFGENR